MFGEPAIGEILHAEQELDNTVDKFAVKVVQNNKTVSHLLFEYLRILWYFLTHGGKICLEVIDRRHHCKHLCIEMENR